MAVHVCVHRLKLTELYHCSQNFTIRFEYKWILCALCGFSLRRQSATFARINVTTWYAYLTDVRFGLP